MDGIIYYNIGTKCLVRLAVSILTLRKVYSGPVTIISDPGCFSQCKAIAEQFGVDILEGRFNTADGKNMAFLNKCRMHEVTPYEKTLFLDSDTIVLQDFSDCFAMLDDYEFIVPQFCKWESRGKAYRTRIKRWKGIIPDYLYDHAFDEPKAVNIGFYGWRKGATIFDQWYNVALMNRTTFIPDEIACQILLPQVPHLVIGSEYNTSCKHEALTDKTKTLHFHGKKHCRTAACNYLYHSDLWYKYFEEVRVFCARNGFIGYDGMLMNNLHMHDVMSGKHAT